MNGIKQDVIMYRGDTNVIEATVYQGETSTPQAITGAVIRWVLYSRIGQIVIDKSTGTGITITNAAGGVFEVQINPADTELLPPGTYRHEAEITDALSNVNTVLTGTFYLRSERA